MAKRIWEAKLSANGIPVDVVLLGTIYWGKHHLIHPARLQATGWPAIPSALVEALDTWTEGDHNIQWVANDCEYVIDIKRTEVLN